MHDDDIRAAQADPEYLRSLQPPHPQQWVVPPSPEFGTFGCRCAEARLPVAQIALAYLVSALALIVLLAGVPLAVLLWRVVL